MLTEKELITELEGMAADFREAADKKNWLRAKALYNKALMVSRTMKIDRKAQENLFGQRSGIDKDEESPDGLFPRGMVGRVDLECCIKRNKSYTDMTVRGGYYSDEDYCARCTKKNRTL